jgi:Domain of unknown function (DUF4112)
LAARTLLEINNIRAAIARVGSLSDSIVGMGPFKIGLDGILAWVPGVGTIYSLGAAGLLMIQGMRARVPAGALLQVTILLGIRTLVTTSGEAAAMLTMLPITIPAELAVDFFRAHKWSADILLKAIDNTVYVEGRRHRSNPNYADIKEQVRSGAERRRVVFLG